MEIVTVYRRHSARCPEKADRYSKRCKCRVWFQYQFNGQQKKISAKTRSWEKAVKRSRQLEVELDARGRGEEPVNKEAALTLEKAIAKYLVALADPMAAREKCSLIKPKRMMTLLREFCDAQRPPVLLVKQITPMLLSEWRSAWTFKPKSSSPRIHDHCARAFFTWCLRMEIIDKDPYMNLPKYEKINPITLPFTPVEMQAILDAVNSVERFTPEQRYKLRALILLQRWSGLSISDALMLTRLRLYSDNSVMLYRKKTGEEVLTAMPDYVATHLRLMPNERPAYFFWDGKAELAAIRNAYSEMLRSVFDVAGISRDRTNGGMTLSHRFRDTFAVEFLLSGGRMEDLADLLGHSSISTTELHYNAWVPARRERLRIIAEESFRKQIAVGLERVSLQ